MADTSGRIPFVTSANKFIKDLGAYFSVLYPTSKYLGLYAEAVYAGDMYAAANSKLIRQVTSTDSLFSDDFGGSALDITNNWDVFDGGLPANPTIHGQTATQLAMGSGITGYTKSVASSKLQIVAPVTNGAEYMLLSQQMFAGKEDISFVFSKSTSDVNLSIRVGLIEVDPTTGIPLINPNIAADGVGAREPTNAAWLDLSFGFSDTTSFTTRAVGDSSGIISSGNVATANNFAIGQQEFHLEVDNWDVQASTCAPDTTTGRLPSVSRVSTQCPNDTKVYKLAIRCRNQGGALGATVTFNFYRIIVNDHYAMDVEVTGGKGDAQAQKAIAAYIVNSAALNVALSSQVMNLAPVVSSGANSVHHLSSAATTNATSVKGSTGVISGGCIMNTSAGTKYFKLFQKATAPTVGTDVPVCTIPIPAGQCLMLGALFGTFGYRMTTGIAYAITGAYTDLDTTAVAAGDVLVQLVYT
jgi:hypothetical protein